MLLTRTIAAAVSGVVVTNVVTAILVASHTGNNVTDNNPKVHTTNQ